MTTRIPVLVSIFALTSLVSVARAGSMPDELKINGFAVGCQAYTFNRFTVFEAIEKTAEAGGKVAPSDWLLGTPVGFRGPWGVSYPANLRLTVQAVTEEEWLKFARVERLPPMPWFNLRDMNDDDLRAVYRFIRALGPKGERMPAALSPKANVGTPYIEFTPKNLPAVSQIAPPAKQGGRG